MSMPQANHTDLDFSLSLNMHGQEGDARDSYLGQTDKSLVFRSSTDLLRDSLAAKRACFVDFFQPFYSIILSYEPFGNLMHEQIVL